MLKLSLALAAASLTASASAFTLHFTNNCPYTVWPAVGRAPLGQVDPSIAYGKRLDQGQQDSFNVADSQTGIRSWARTGCDAQGANCQTGACNGGLVCTDAGITAGVIYGEYGYQPDGNVISWDLSRVDATVNVPVTINNGGNVKTCQNDSCPPDQAFDNPYDFGATTTSPVGSTFDINFC